MKPIPFTQYLRPMGKAVDVYFDCEDALAEKAEELIGKGLRFEAEVLTTGAVSLTVYDPALEEDIAIQICPNGPEIENAVNALVKEAADLRKVL